jgi:uncharacterized protein (DUF1800 family)
MSLLCTAARRKNPVLTEGEAARFLRQASMGVRSYAEVQAMAGTRRETWINNQFALTWPRTGTKPNLQAMDETMYNMANNRGAASGTTAWFNQYIYGGRQAMTHRMLRHPDRLRMKIVRCLHEYFSVGETNDGAGSDTYALFTDLLDKNALGTFQSLLTAVTLSPEMGRWLTFKGNKKASATSEPDENYAREVMQLFTIGLWELNQDGTRKRYQDLSVSDSRYKAAGTANSTDEVPTYGQNDIRALAKVFTGLDAEFTVYANLPFKRLDDAGGGTTSAPQSSVGEVLVMSFNLTASGGRATVADHDFTAKTALYGWININAASATVANANTELDYVMNRLANHPSCAPFFCKRMIEMMVTSIPSPEYVARVASVFQNDGTGQVGNLSAVFKAILLDQEAAAPASNKRISRLSHMLDLGHAVAQIYPVISDTDGGSLALFSGNVSRGHEFISFSREDASGGGDAPADTRYGMKSMRSVFGRIPARYSTPTVLKEAGQSAPEAFLFDENGATLAYNAVANGGGGGANLGDLASNNATDAGLLVTAGNIPSVINKWSILFTGDTAPQAFKDSLNTFITSNFPRADATNRTLALKNIMAALMLSPYGMVRT